MAATHAQGQIAQIELECGLACDNFQATKIGAAMYAPVLAARTLGRDRELRLSSDLVLPMPATRDDFRAAVQSLRTEHDFTLQLPAHAVYDAHMQRQPSEQLAPQNVWLSFIDEPAELAPSQTGDERADARPRSKACTVIHAEAAGFVDATALTSLLKTVAVALCKAAGRTAKPAECLTTPSIRYRMLHVERAAREFTRSAREFLI